MYKLVSCIIIISSLFACSSNNTNQVGANNSASKSLVYMSSKKAPNACKLRGQIHGPQETFSTNSNFKLGKNISQAHINQARELGANYVEMNPAETGGKAYKCPISTLMDLKPY